MPDFLHQTQPVAKPEVQSQPKPQPRPEQKAAPTSSSTSPTPKKNGRSAFAVNLVSHSVAQASSSSSSKKNLILIGGSLGLSLGIVGFLFGGLFIYQHFADEKTQPLKDRLGEVNASIGALESKATKYANFQNQLGTIKTMLDNHVYWTKSIQAIEEHTLPNVSYENFSISSQTYTVSTTGFAPDYATVGKQLLVLQQAPDVFPSVQINSANAQVDTHGQLNGVKFSITFTINPSIIKKKQ